MAASTASAVLLRDYKRLWANELKESSPDIAILEEYKNAGAINVNSDIINSRDNPLSLRLSRKSDLKLIEALLKWGANPNLIKHRVPVFWGVFTRSIKDMNPLLALLIKYGANVKIVANNKTSLMAFFESFIYKDDVEFSQKHKEIADILIKEGVDIHLKDRLSDVLDALDICIIMNNDVTIRYLLDKGMSMIINGRTRLYYYILRMHIVDDLRLKTLMKYYSNDNEYFRDFLDAALINPEVTMSHNLYILLKNELNPNYKEVYVDGSTPLIKAVQLYEKVPQQWVKTMIETMLEKGANASYIDPSGKKAIDYTTNDEIKELLGEKPFKILWMGFSKADIAFTNEIFHQTTDASNLAKINPDESLFSICPVCLKYIQHETGTCMYMIHSCVEEASHNGYYHKNLWNAFSYEKQLYDPQGNPIPGASKRVLEWCTNCGRICKGHRHYAISPIYKADKKDIFVPPLVGYGSDYFATDCSKQEIGGGGIKEKLKRYRRFREVVLGLNDPSIIGKMSYEEAINILVENVWEAPLENRRFEISKIERLQKEKKYNYPVANIQFPLPSELPLPPKYIYSDPTYPDAGNPDLLPLVYSTATNSIKNSAYTVFQDNENIIQFRHRMANGMINKHDGPNQQIALDRLISFISVMNELPASDDFGMCWQHTKDAYDNLEMLDDKTRKPPKCTAKLYPDELFHAIQSATYADEEAKQHNLRVYEYYKKLFGEKFGKPIGFAPNSNNSHKSNNSNASHTKYNSNHEGGRRTRKDKHKRKHNRLIKRGETMRNYAYKKVYIL